MFALEVLLILIISTFLVNKGILIALLKLFHSHELQNFIYSIIFYFLIFMGRKRFLTFILVFWIRLSLVQFSDKCLLPSLSKSVYLQIKFLRIIFLVLFWIFLRSRLTPTWRNWRHKSEYEILTLSNTVLVFLYFCPRWKCSKSNFCA